MKTKFVYCERRAVKDGLCMEDYEKRELLRKIRKMLFRLKLEKVGAIEIENDEK